jgi:FkbM family methyltransferase
MEKLKFKIQATILNWVGGIIRILYNNKIPYKSLLINTKSTLVNNKTVALIYFGKYEKDELKFVLKYLPKELPIIELGTSLGFVALNAAQQTNNKIICLEANKKLIPLIEESFKLNLVSPDQYQILNCALSHKKETVCFSDRGSNELGKLVEYSENVIEAIPLEEVTKLIPGEDYVLISDIEGAEINFLHIESDSLKKCKMMIIELHDTEFKGNKYSIKELVEMLCSKSFELIEQSNNTYVFSNKMINLNPQS